MKIAYCSDLHLEFGKRNFELPDADLLLLAGDILMGDAVNETNTSFISESAQNQIDFLFDVNHKYKKVIFIPGNHEYYHTIYDNVPGIINGFLKKEGLSNIEFTQRGVFNFDDVQIIAATLWTDLRKMNPMVVEVCRNYMNDYRVINKIYTTESQDAATRPLRPSDTYDFHIADREFIKNILESSEYKKKVVVTHHAPSEYSLDPDYAHVGSDGAEYAYACTDMEYMLFDCGVHTWVHGHTHFPVDYTCGDEPSACRVVSNPRGYHGAEHIASSFDIMTFDV